MHESTRVILEYNAGRDPERLTRKLAAIAADPFSFFRGTNNLYAASMIDAPLMHEAPRTLVCGDLHLENFGSFKGECLVEIVHVEVDQAVLTLEAAEVLQVRTAWSTST